MIVFSFKCTIVIDVEFKIPPRHPISVKLLLEDRELYNTTVALPPQPFHWELFYPM